LQYDPNKNGSGIRSIMWPSYISSFLQDFAGLNVEHIEQPTFQTLWMLDYSKDHLIGLVNSGLLYSGEVSSGGFADHYVVIHGFVNQYRGSGDISYWNWGWESPRTLNRTFNEVNKLLFSIWVITK